MLNLVIIATNNINTKPQLAKIQEETSELSTTDDRTMNEDYDFSISEDDDDNNMSDFEDNSNSINDLSYTKGGIPQLQIENLITNKQKLICKLLNLEAVADDLVVPVRYLLSYFAFSQTTQFTANVDTHKYSLVGNFDICKLQDALSQYMSTYLLCQNCGLYEGNPSYTSSSAKKKNATSSEKIDISLDCKACGVSMGVAKSNFDLVLKEEIDSFEREEAERVELEEKEIIKGVKGLLDGKEIFTFCDNVDAMIEYVRKTLVDEGKPVEEVFSGLKTKFNVPETYNARLFYVVFDAIFNGESAVFSQERVHQWKAILEEAAKSTFGSVDDHLEFEILMSLNRIFAGSKQYKALSSILFFFYDEDLLSEEYLEDFFAEDSQSKFTVTMDFRYELTEDKAFRGYAQEFVNWLKQ
jgi:translation initiation factor 2 beta subunit (eIF-2beta)/eIF-5